MRPTSDGARSYLIQPPLLKPFGCAQIDLQLGREHLGEEEEGGEPDVAFHQDEEIRTGDVSHDDQGRQRRTLAQPKGDRLVVAKP